MDLAVLSLYPAKPWYVSPEDFKVASPRIPSDAYQFRVLYFNHRDIPTYPDMSSKWASRGEDLPIMMDDSYPGDDAWCHGGTVSVPVLRLNGSVNFVTVETTDQHTFSVWDK